MSNNNIPQISGKRAKTIVNITDFKIVVLPSNLDLDSLLLNHNITLSYPLNKNIIAIKNRCYVILNQIVQRASLNKDLDLFDNEGYISLHSNVLRKLVPNYKEYIDWLTNVNVLESDNYFINGYKSIGYRFTDYYAGCKTTSVHHIYDSTLVNNSQQCSNTNNKYQGLLRDLKQLKVDKIDFNSSEIQQLIRDQKRAIRNKIKSDKKTKNLNIGQKVQLLKRSSLMKELAWQQSITSFKDGTIYFKQDQTSFRLHTNVTGLKKEFRKYLSINGQKLVAADIKNSQPYMSLAFFNKNLNPAIQQIIDSHCAYLKVNYRIEYSALTKLLNQVHSGQQPSDVTKYINDVTSGQIYEVMMNIWNTALGLQMTREDAKIEIFKIFFQPPLFTTNKKTVFKKTYPTVYRIIELINHGFTRTKKQKRSLLSKYNFIDTQGNVWACILQNIESHIVLDVVCDNLKQNYPNVPLITVHDSIATTEVHYKKVEGELNHALKNLIGHTPSLRKEPWS